MIFFQAGNDDPHHQETGYDEEYIYADKTAGKTRDAEMKKYDGDHCTGSKPVDVMSEIL